MSSKTVSAVAHICSTLRSRAHHCCVSRKMGQNRRRARGRVGVAAPCERDGDDCAVACTTVTMSAFLV